MSPRSSAAVYAQMRRDNEIKTREALKATIPAAFITDDIENDGTLNPTSKVMLAAQNFISSFDETAMTLSGSKDDQNITAQESVPFLIRSDLKFEQPEDLRQLRQVAQRLVHKVEECIHDRNKIPGRLQPLLVRASDVLIDLIEEVEQTTVEG